MRVIKGRLLAQRLLGDPSVVHPYQIPDLSAWWDASTLGLSDTDPVATWPDLSGSGHDLTQATGANQPLFRVINNIPRVRFDGSNDSLHSATAPAMPAADWTMACVFSYHDTPSINSGVFSLGAVGQNDFNGTDGAAIHSRSAGDASVVAFIKNNGTPTALVGGWATNVIQAMVVHAAQFAPNLNVVSELRQQVSGGALVSVGGAWTPTQIVMGARWLNGVAAPYGPVDIYEALLVSRSLTQDEKAGLRQYLRLKYSW